MVISPVVGHGHVGEKWGPVLGVTALPASTPITQSVEEFIIDSVYSVFLASLIKKSVDIFSLGEIGKKFKMTSSPGRGRRGLQSFGRA